MWLNSWALDNPYFFITLAALLGLLIGSFLNVVIYRLPLMINAANQQAAASILKHSTCTAYDRLSVTAPSSFCPACQKKLPLSNKLPIISYLFLKGLAACCGKKISARYLVVEIISATLAGGLAAKYGLSAQFLSSLYLLFILITLTFIDIQHFILPDQLTLTTLWLGLVVNLSSLFCSIEDAALGAALGYLAFFITASLFEKLRKIPGLGRGDCKLLAALGAWFGWQQLPAIILIASITGIIYSLFYFPLGRKRLTARIPFGPFLSLAGILVLFGIADMTHFTLFKTYT